MNEVDAPLLVELFLKGARIKGLCREVGRRRRLAEILNTPTDVIDLESAVVTLSVGAPMHAPSLAIEKRSIIAAIPLGDAGAGPQARPRYEHAGPCADDGDAHRGVFAAVGVLRQGAHSGRLHNDARPTAPGPEHLPAFLFGDRGADDAGRRLKAGGAGGDSQPRCGFGDEPGCGAGDAKAS